MTQNTFIISSNPNSLFSQGLALALQQKGHYQVSTIAYTDIPQSQSYSHTLPLFLWHQNEQQKIFESIEAVQKTQPKVFIIVQDTISKEQIQSLVQRGKIAIADIGISVEELYQYIQELQAGNKEWVFSPGIISVLIEQLFSPASQATATQLNSKEQQILDCARKGYSLKRTAQELNLSKNTVAAYRTRILKKAGTKSINQLIARYNE